MNKLKMKKKLKEKKKMKISKKKRRIICEELLMFSDQHM